MSLSRLFLAARLALIPKSQSPAIRAQEVFL
jgi:hypothetical protein